MYEIYLYEYTENVTYLREYTRGRTINGVATIPSTFRVVVTDRKPVLKSKKLIYSSKIDGNATALDISLVYEKNKPGSLEFTLSPEHPLYKDINLLKSIVTVEKDNKEIWRGRAVEVERDMNNYKNIYCEGSLAFLKDILIQFPENWTTDGTDALDFLDYIFAAYNDPMTGSSAYRKIILDKHYVGGTIQLNPPKLYVSMGGSSSSSARLDESVNDGDERYKYISVYNALVDIWAPLTGGSVRVVENVDGDSRSGFPLRLLHSFETDIMGVPDINSEKFKPEDHKKYVEEFTAKQTIKFGENLLDLNEHIDASEIFTAVRPFGTKENVKSGGGVEEETRIDLLGHAAGGLYAGMYGVNSFIMQSIYTTDPEYCEKNGTEPVVDEGDTDDGNEIHFWQRRMRFLTDKLGTVDGFNFYSNLSQHEYVKETFAWPDDGESHPPRPYEYGLISIKEGVELFGLIIKTMIFENVKSSISLAEEAMKVLENALAKALTIDISAVDLSLIDVDVDEFEICDMVRVVSPPHNLNRWFEFAKIELDICNPENSTYSLGTSFNGITDVIAQNNTRLKNGDNNGNAIHITVTDATANEGEE